MRNMEKMLMLAVLGICTGVAGSELTVNQRGTLARQSLSVQHTAGQAEALVREGNKLFLEDKYQEAVARYIEAKQLFERFDSADFAKRVKEILGAPFVNLARAGDVASRIAFVGGGGGSFITNARDAGADTFVSGDIGYHALTDAPDFKYAPLNLLEVGHFYSEHPVCEVLKSMVLSIASDVTCDIYFSNVIKAI